jgi:hypothetical protein
MRNRYALCTSDGLDMISRMSAESSDGARDAVGNVEHAERDIRQVGYGHIHPSSRAIAELFDG